MTNKEVLEIALRQSAIDCHCAPEDFLSNSNVLTLSQADPRARAYLPLPLACDLVSYGPNIVAQVSEPLRDIVSAYIGAHSVAHCFETPNLHALDRLLEPHGLKVCFQAEYFLPDMTLLRERPCAFRIEMLSDFSTLYASEWSNALSMEHPERDVLALGAYDGSRLIGLAGCSADCESMYQIGIDVLPAWRGQGVAAALTSRLALEIVALGRVPFYCAAWSNIPSVRNAIKSGFRPAWVELTARESALVDRLNQ